MAKHLILFATLAEAQHTIDRLNAVQVNEQLFSFDHGHIALSGYGVFAASSTIYRYRQLDLREIWNLGAAGALDTSLSLGKVYEVSTASMNPLQPLDPIQHANTVFKTSYPSLQLKAAGSKLITSLYPIHSTTARGQLIESGDLVDMEGYGVADAARRLACSCRLWKAVSDFSNADGPQSIANMLNSVSQALADTVIENLRRENSPL